jgi:hypothetical protein
MTSGVCVLDVPQRSDMWRQARCGRLTGSRAAAMLATVKYGEAVTRAALRAALVHEQLTGGPHDDGFVSAAMLRSVRLEPVAIAAYEVRTGLVVPSSAFLAHDSSRSAAASMAMSGTSRGSSRSSIRCR